MPPSEQLDNCIMISASTGDIGHAGLHASAKVDHRFSSDLSRCQSKLITFGRTCAFTGVEMEVAARTVKQQYRSSKNATSCI